MKRISVDSIPKISELCYDYASSQVYSKCALTLLKSEVDPLPGYKPSYHGEIESENERSFTVVLKEAKTYEDGKEVNTSHYLERLEYLQQKNPLINATILNGISIESDSSKIVFSSKGALAPLKTLMSTILFTPKPKHSPFISAGEYTLKNTGENIWCAENRQERDDKVQFITIKDTGDNYRLCESGYLDQSADTATINKNCIIKGYSSNSRMPSLHAYLVFEGKLAKANPEMRFFVCSIISECMHMIKSASKWVTTIEELNFNSTLPMRSKYKNYFKQNPLVLTYNDFYPNVTVVNLISMALSTYEINHKLIHDDYYRPSFTADVRLSIIKGLIPGVWGQFASLIFTPVLRSERDVLQRNINILRKEENIENLKSEISLNSLYLCPFLYLGELTSFFYRREKIEIAC
ncbi:hypothetical protein [Pectobacterium sp. A5351]|uniref:hypothetical protein n=1 Tax=Pectobacterium sp. A5351 TaxID=2914983 RepID=UPI00232CEAB6|nr:hypothetical protein [Pectobacterium sp. A5351]WCG83583.1 hypothetical protein O1Q74_02410 [Pectobacterium sp. A5351]